MFVLLSVGKCEKVLLIISHSEIENSWLQKTAVHACLTQPLAYYNY